MANISPMLFTELLMVFQYSFHTIERISDMCSHLGNAPVICIPGSPGAGDSGDIAGLKCQALTSDANADENAP